MAVVNHPNPPYLDADGNAEWPEPEPEIADEGLWVRLCGLLLPRKRARALPVWLYWCRKMKRTSWIYCPTCRRDLNGDNESFVDDMGSEVRYTCATCKTNSTFDLDAPVPIYLGPWLT